jgi:hypothetical protein
MGRGIWTRGAAAVGLLVGITAGLPVGVHAAGGSGCTSGQWTVMSTPAIPADSSLGALLTLSPADMWAGGQENLPRNPAIGANGNDLLEHRDGSQWSVVPGSGVPGSYVGGFAGAASNDVWAFGAVESVGSLIEHWNGSSWHMVPNAAPPNGIMTGGVALSADDAWAAGTAWTPRTVTAFIERWNGVAWSVVNVFPGQAAGQLTATSDSDVWLSTGFGAEHWDGSTWTYAPFSTANHSDVYLGAMTAAGNARWAAGQTWDGTNLNPELQQWNGSVWTDVTPVPAQPGIAQFTGISAASDTDAWAVGTRVGQTSPAWPSTGTAPPGRASRPSIPDPTSTRSAR